LLLIVGILAASGIFLLDLYYLQPRLDQHEQTRLRERAGAAQVTTQFALHVVEDRLVDLARAWRRDATVRGILNGTTPVDEFGPITEEALDYHGEHVWLTDSHGQLLATCHSDCPVFQQVNLQDIQTGDNMQRRGIMKLGETVTVYAATRVLSRRGQWHSSGMLWVARPLDDGVLAHSAAAIDGQIVFIPSDQMPVGTDPDTSAAHASWVADGERLMVAWPTNDNNGNMLGYFRADIPVTSISRQTATIRKLVIGILILSAGVTLLLVTATHILIAGPIVRLLKRLRSFEAGHLTTKDLSKQLHGESRILADELETAFNRLATMSQTDPLTGLANRGHFERVLDTCYQQAVRYHRPLTVMAMDVDFFKTINDTHGHQAGDAALIALAEALKTACRRADLAGRIGGDEFCVILPETDRDAAIVVAERLRDLMTSGDDDHAPAKLLTLSIGIADLQSGHNGSPDELLDLADQALYAAKQQGRDRIVLAGELQAPVPA